MMDEEVKQRIMTRLELSTEIQQLEQRANDAREDGNSSLLYRTLVAIDELAEEMGVQQHEFAGGYE